MINVHYGGRSHITDHMRTVKYMSARKTSASSRVKSYLKKIVPNLPCAMAEGTFI